MDTCLKRKKYLEPQVSALDRFYCRVIRKIRIAQDMSRMQGKNSKIRIPQGESHMELKNPKRIEYYKVWATCKRASYKQCTNNSELYTARKEKHFDTAIQAHEFEYGFILKYGSNSHSLRKLSVMSQIHCSCTNIIQIYTAFFL